MTQNEMAVAVAKDVLEHIHLLEINQGVYLQKEANPIFSRNGKLQPFIDELSEGCHVCALGAYFLSYVRLYDNFNIEDCAWNTPDFLSVGFPSLTTTLLNIFTFKEIRRIEAAFEGFSGWGEDVEEYFQEHYHLSPKERLVRIMQNIIDNNGVFTPKEGPVDVQ